jgi:hypothetical protein
MAKYLLLISFLYVQIVDGQIIKQLDGRWSFTGLRTTVFKVTNEKLYVGMLEYADTSNFNRFMNGLPIDSTVFNEAFVIEKDDTIATHVNFPSIDHNLQLVYVLKDSSNMLFTGDDFFDSTRIIVADKNCNLNEPSCNNRLYNASDLKAILQLRPMKHSRVTMRLNFC